MRTTSVRSTPRGFERVTFTFYPWLIMILGGMGNNLGVANGVLIFVTIYRLLDVYKYEIGAVVGFDPVWLGYMLFGALALAIIIAAPRGIVPEEAKPLTKPSVQHGSGAISGSKGDAGG